MQDHRNQCDLQFVINFQHLSSGSGVTEWTEVPLPHFNLFSPWFEKIPRDDPVFQFWRATAHDMNISSLRSNLVFEFPDLVLICVDLVLQETHAKTCSRKPASHV